MISIFLQRIQTIKQNGCILENLQIEIEYT